MSDNQVTAPAYDWSRFLKRVNIKTTTQKTYDSWATQDGLEQWFLRQAIFTSIDGKPRSRSEPVQKGDRYEWLWHGYADDTIENGTVEEANGKDGFRFLFGKAGIVTVSIKTEQNEVMVTLLQENIPTDEQSKVNFHLGCIKGWVFYLANLKSILEGGIDLRNRNPALKDVITA